MEHIDIPLGERHAPHNWEYANAASREAATGIVPGEIGCLALQLDDGSYWRLASVGPVVWVSAVSPDWAYVQNKPTFGTASALNAPASGDAAADEVVLGDDTRLTNAMTTVGDLIVGGVSGAPARLGIGSDGQFLKLVGGTLTWEDASGGGAARNLVINGGFIINQRAVSGTVILDAGTHGHDRWKAGASGCTYTFATSANVTTITISAGSLVHVVEGTLLQSGNVVLSWAGTAQGKIAAGSFGASGITATATGGTNLNIEFGTGTLASVQLESGTIANAFEIRPPTIELLLCMRYFFSWVPGASARVFGIGQCYTTTNAAYHLKTFTVPMRAAPTVTTSAATDFAVSTSNAGSAILSAVGTWLTTTTEMVTNSTTSAALLTAGNVSVLYSQTANAYVFASADL